MASARRSGLVWIAASTQSRRPCRQASTALALSQPDSAEHVDGAYSVPYGQRRLSRPDDPLGEVRAILSTHGRIGSNDGFASAYP